MDLAATTRKRGYRLQHVSGAGGRSAIDQQNALAAGLRYYSGFALDADNIEIVGKFNIAWGFGGGLGRCRKAKRWPSKDHSGRTGHRGLQELAAG
jgi:hypothetical protein